MKLYTNHSLHKRQDLWHKTFRTKIYNFYSLLHIYFQNFSLEYYCIFFLKRYLFKYQRILTFIKRDLLQVLDNTRHLNLPCTKYKLPTILIRKNK
jgi:hypothetical protein